MKKLTTITALAFAAISLGTVAASAQVTPAAGANDLVLGFEVLNDPGTTGSNTNLELDLGPASGFVPGLSYNNLGLLGTDLSNVYGSNWATRTDLVWSVAGLVASNTYDVTSSSQPTERSSYVNNIGSLTSTLNTTDAIPATGVSAATVGTTANPASSIGGSYTADVSAAGGDFGIPSLSIGESQAGGANGTDGTIDLYKFVRAQGTTTPASLLGDFVLSGSGTSATFAFNPVAAPEPSAYALAITAGLLFLVLRRRNSVA